jgi:hypothetical protein
MMPDKRQIKHLLLALTSLLRARVFKAPIERISLWQGRQLLGVVLVVLSPPYLEAIYGRYRLLFKPRDCWNGGPMMFLIEYYALTAFAGNNQGHS